MSVLGHIAIGVVAARFVTPTGPAPRAAPLTEAPAPGRLPTRMAALAALALLPDSDFLLHVLFPGVDALQHRGATHSLAVAVVVGIVVVLALTAAGADRALWWGVLAGLVMASHGVMDMLGNTSLGVELLWPFSDARLLAPWQLLPDPSLVPPFSRNFLGPLVVEAIAYVPAWLFAFWPRSAVRRDASGPGSTTA